MARFIDWVNATLTQKTTTIDGTEAVYLDDAGSSVKAALSDAIRYGGGSGTRITTVGNANIHQKSDGTMWLEVTGQTAGNARGAGAFDWQAERSTASAVASGANAIAIGVNCTASGQNSSAFGTNVVATNRNQIAFGTATFAAVGQGNLQTFFNSTTDATSTPLNIANSATARMVIPSGKSLAFTGIVQAIVRASSSSIFVKAWEIKGVICRDESNNTRIVGTPTITVLAQDADGTPTPSTWAIASITADDTNEALAINVTGQAGTTIRWQATLIYSQVGF